MTIGFDGKRAAQNRTGLGNYSRFVIKSLARSFPAERLKVYVPSEAKARYLSEIPRMGNIDYVYPDRGGWQRVPSAWRVWGITPQLERDGIDIFHGLSNELPLTIDKAACKKVVTIHDLIMMSHPQLYPAIDRAIYTAKIKKACRMADKIVAVSDFTARQLEERLGVSRRKIEVIYQGCDPIFAVKPAEATMDEVKRRYNLPARFMLYVGTIEERKNLMLVAEALRMLAGNHPGEDIKVVAIGRPTPYLDKVKRFLAENGLADRMIFLHNVPYGDLPVIYYLARVFVYPSVVEGFGIPLLEAVTAGVPAIGCSGSCLEEAGGEGSLYVDPHSPEAMADAIQAVWTDRNLRREMRESGLRHAARFAENLLADEMMALYRSL